MAKTCTLHVRMEPTLRVEAEKILKKLGMTPSEAINIFYKQICLRSGLPFEVIITDKSKNPNENFSQKRRSLSRVSIKVCKSRFNR